MTSITDLFSLDGKVAVVTGASSGLGVAFAQGFAEAGADVALGARRVDKLADTAALVEGPGARAITRRDRRRLARGVPGTGRRGDGGRSAGSTYSSTTRASAPPSPPPARRPSSSAR